MGQASTAGVDPEQDSVDAEGRAEVKDWGYKLRVWTGEKRSAR
jgi:hypothetical protein